MGEVPADVMEGTWVDVASFSDSRGRSETKRAQREQPHLFDFVLGATEHLPPAVHALGFYIFLVIWQAFARATTGKIPRVTAGAIERRRQENEQALSRFQGAMNGSLNAPRRLTSRTNLPSSAIWLRP